MNRRRIKAASVVLSIVALGLLFVIPLSRDGLAVMFGWVGDVSAYQVAAIVGLVGIALGGGVGILASVRSQQLARRRCRRVSRARW